MESRAFVAILIVALLFGGMASTGMRSTNEFSLSPNGFDVHLASTLDSNNVATNGMFEVSKPGQLVFAVHAASLNSPSNFTLVANIVSMADRTTENLFVESEKWQNPNDSTENFTMLWTPETTGAYSVNFFLVSNSNDPTLLSDPAQSQVTVVTASDFVTPVQQPNTTGTAVVTPVVANYTLLIYIVGADLESSAYVATDNILQMMKANSSSSVNVIIETGGSSGAKTDNFRFIDFTKVQRFKITHGNFQLVQDLGFRNMGSPSTLSDFLSWGMKNYPANRYALSLWDHGAGIYGYGYDNIYQSTLSLDDIRQALSDSTTSAGKQFELIGFDACLMSSIEVVAKVAPYAHYLASSEEVEPSWGWNYTAVINSLVQSPQQDGKALGKEIADSYMASAKYQETLHPGFAADRGLTFSVVDLSQAPALVNAATTLGQYLQQAVVVSKSAFAAERSLQHTERYGVSFDRSSGHVDLYELTSLISSNMGSSTATYVSVVQDAINKAVVYNVHGAARPNAHGISIFLSSGQTPSDTIVGDMIDGWPLAIKHMKANVLVDYSPPDVNVGQEGVNGELIHGYIQGDNIANVTRFVLNQTDSSGQRVAIISYEIIDPSQIINSTQGLGQGLVQFTWNKGAYFLCSGSSCIPVSIFLDERQEITYGFVQARIEGASYNGSILLLYEKDGNSFDFLGAWPGFDSQGNAERDISPLSPGDKVFPKFTELDAANAGYARDYEVGPLIVGNETSLVYKLSGGTYYMQMEACHFSGLCGFSTLFQLG